MFKLIFGAVLAGAVAAYAGVLYLELPAGYDAEMVLNPTDEERAMLRGFVFDELAKLDNDYTCRIVVLTKNGKPVFGPPRLSEEKDIESKPTLGHVHFHRGYGFSDKKWDAAVWHLHEVGQPEKDGVAAWKAY
jgi:hypothetical protein